MNNYFIDGLRIYKMEKPTFNSMAPTQSKLLKEIPSKIYEIVKDFVYDVHRKAPMSGARYDERQKETDWVFLMPQYLREFVLEGMWRDKNLMFNSVQEHERNCSGRGIVLFGFEAKDGYENKLIIFHKDHPLDPQKFTYFEFLLP